jgi:glycosyltransferase involved in cell wall biosynthesis
VAYYVASWPPGHDASGIVPYVGTLVHELEARGHVTSVHAAQVAGGAILPGVYPLDPYPRRPLTRRLVHRLTYWINPTLARDRALSRALVVSLRKAIAERGTELLEIEDSYGWSRAVQRRIPIPVVVRLHGPWFLNGPVNRHPPDALFHRRIRMEGLAIGRADGITAPSRDVLERTRAHYGLALENAEVIPPPVPEVPAAQRWSSPASDPDVILFIGRFDLHKGGDLIIDALQRVLARIPRARLRFVGVNAGVTDSAGKTWLIQDYTEARIPGAFSSGRVEWLDRQPHAALAGLRQKAAVTVVCSRYETFGLTATEAMSQGCPVVVSEAGALPEIVQDGVNGLVCRSNNPDDLAEKLRLLLDQPAYAERLGHQAAIDCQQRYNPGLLAARSVDYYQRVIAQARARHHTSMG